MAKKTYIGIPVNGVGKSKRVPDIGYIGIGGKSKRLLKGYIGIAGKAKLFWEYDKEGEYWDFYETQAVTFIHTQLYSRNFFKVNTGIAYFAVVHAVNTSGYGIIIVSPDEDAVRYGTNWDGRTFGASGTIEMKGDTWYWGGWNYFVYGTENPYPTGYTPDCLLENPRRPDGRYPISTITPAEDLINNVYSNNLDQDYKVGQTYSLRSGDIQKTVRKILGIFLYKSISLKNQNCYIGMLSKVDDIVNYVLSDATANDNIYVLCNMYLSSGNFLIRVTIYYTTDSINNISITSKHEEFGYKYFEYRTYLRYYKYRVIDFDASGNISTSAGSFSGNIPRHIGCVVFTSLNNIQVLLSNIGLSL